MRSLRLDSPLFLILAFSIFALAPLTAPGYFIYGHDARHSVYFLQMFDMSLRDGAWYPRWATDMVFGYGYPLWIILAPIPFFAGEVFHLIGLDFVSAVKMVDGFALLLSALSMYLFASSVLEKPAGLVAAVAYAYIPYHLVDLYVRSAQAELVAYVFPPLVFWAFFRLFTTRHPKYIPLAAFAYAGLLLAHIQTAALFTPVIAAYLLCLWWANRPREQTSLATGKGMLRTSADVILALSLALGLAAVFVLPVMLEQRYLTTEPLIGGFYSYRKHFVNASQLLSPFWGYGVAGENGTDQFSLQLGLIPVLLAFLSLSAWRRISSTVRLHVGLFALTAGVMIVAMLPLAAGLWDTLAPIAAYLQFSWRLLIITSFALAFLSGSAIHALADDWRETAPILVIVLVIVMGSYAYTEPQHTDAVFNYQAQMEFEVKDRELLGDTVWMSGARPQDSPLVAQYISGEPLQKAVPVAGTAQIEILGHGGQSDRVRVQAPAPTPVMFYTRFFPGWVARIDGQRAPAEPYGEQGLILVQVPQGTHIVEIRYEGTSAQEIGTLVSLSSLVVSLVWLILATKRARKA